MPVERRCARDGASARTHTTAPERGNPTKSGRTSAQNGFPLCRNKGVDRQGETRASRTADIVDALAFMAQHSNK
jgi:hypothetical protein